MIILVNWVTNFRPTKFQKSSILTPCFQILGNTLSKDNTILGGRQCEGTFLACVAGTFIVLTYKN